jgi:WXXGXW repeat (2 copies)
LAALPQSVIAMSVASRLLQVGFLTLAALIFPYPLVSAQDNPAQEKITVLSQGPIHEAYAQPVDKSPQPTPVVPNKPPDPIPEEPPPRKPDGDNVQWIPGYWTWDTDRQQFIWVSGCWRQTPPGRKWVPGHWTQVSGGWQWVPGFWAAASQQELAILPPPPPSVEEGPSTPAPDDNSFYVPGSWTYHDTGYAWRPGFWSPTYADWVWTPASYSWTPSGCISVDGYWDYPFASRGQLFAPVCFNEPLWSTPGWFYCPTSLLDVGGIFPSLFVRPAWHHYYFGNHGHGYGWHGTYPWHSWARSHYDPLFAYSSGRHRSDPRGLQGRQHTLSSRRNGELPQIYHHSAAADRPFVQRGGSRTATPFSGIPGSALSTRSSVISSYSRPQMPSRSAHYGSMPRGGSSFARPAPATHSAGHSSGYRGGGHSAGGGHGGGGHSAGGGHGGHHSR